MAEESKARLVRCLRCDSLIKELPRYSFFKCGSCAAVLQAKKKEQVSNVREHRLNPGRIEKREGYVDDYMSQSKNPMNYWAHQRHDHHDLNINRSRSVNSSRESKFGVYSPRLDNSSRSLRLKGVDRDGFGGFYKRSLETIDEGPSSYRTASAYGYCKPVNRFECLDVPNGVRNFERDRAEVLKKLDELKDQLSRSHDMPQRPTELVPSDNKMDSSDHLGSSIGMSSAHLRLGQYHYSMNNDENVVNFYGNYHSVKHTRPHPQQRTYGYEHHLASYMNQEEALYHLTACSCLYCYDKNRKGPLRVTPAAFGNRGSLKDPCNSTSNHYVSSNRVGQHYLPRPQSNFEDTPVHLWPSDIGSDIDGFGRRCIRKVVLTERKNQLCHPIASGAPFITCYNCLELLKLPRKFRKMMDNEQRLQCGSCSTVIVFEMRKKGLIISVPGNLKQTPTEAEEASNGCFNAGGTIQQISKEDQSPANVIDWRDSPGSSELPFSSDISTTVSSLPFRDRTKLEHQEKVILVKSASQAVSGKNSLRGATEAEVSFNRCRSSSSSRYSLEGSKEQNQLKLPKGSRSFLGLIKKSFRDFSRSNDDIKNERPNVSVNGHPISENGVRRAERQAGQVFPGNYWYDSRAGFWGVMGQPCSGIIPPFIEEFNYPMTKNCAAGNTGVFINGRELHQKDLDLLVCKGLPTASDKSYIMEFSGRVLDEDTGVELYTLGKLAPTVEKEKRGFGMRVPGAVE
ncbi:hypothetical protein Goshw_023232 [Gossypium schwendimanii]|uniref:Zinc-ribbon domain-containing protein n=1 Tax=Gossypium schwendimanii TaxID=34291 RepID=A0A7J9KYU0_GOSSC|nr:hypothetical protein [Gossypium schwendimanii]